MKESKVLHEKERAQDKQRFDQIIWNPEVQHGMQEERRKYEDRRVITEKQQIEPKRTNGDDMSRNNGERNRKDEERKYDSEEKNEYDEIYFENEGFRRNSEKHDKDKVSSRTDKIQQIDYRKTVEKNGYDKKEDRIDNGQNSINPRQKEVSFSK